ncbi:hypothetical protein CJF42_16135, partial [Pseudoalteromonas sp. NBT06-2]|uniref:SH3 domain-containing protein n=1 Tax=Pseudoalteromonas sp. NBT06-2 TaxID=2025950 RepID=UPI000BD726B0
SALNNIGLPAINDLAVKAGLSSVASEYINNYQSTLNSIGLSSMNDLAVKSGLSSVASDYINNYQSALNNIGLSSINDMAVKAGLSSVDFDYINNYQSVLNNIGLSSMNELAVKAGLSSVSDFINNHQAIFRSHSFSEIEVGESFSDFDDEIVNELNSFVDVDLLSDKAKKALKIIFIHFFWPIMLGLITNEIYNSKEKANDGLLKLNTTREVKSFVRKSIDSALLINYRATKVNNLRFRDKPSMKSNILYKLPIGSLVEVLDKSNRAWLLVEVEVDGEYIQGWLSRKHTIKFK